MAAIAFPLGLKNNPITQRINHNTNKGIANIIQKIVMKKISQIILRINHTRATVFFSFGS